MSRVSRVGAIGAVIALGLALSGCAGEAETDEAPDQEINESQGVEPESEDSDAPATNAKEISGTITVGDEAFEAETGWCNFVQVEDEWRILVEFPEGEAMFEGPMYGDIKLEDDRSFSIGKNDDGPNIEVGQDGVMGESRARLRGGDDDIRPVEVDIVCHYD